MYPWEGQFAAGEGTVLFKTLFMLYKEKWPFNTAVAYSRNLVDHRELVNRNFDSLH